MIIDHIAWVFIDLETLSGQMMHAVGRVVAPMMAYFLAIGFAKSQDRGLYLARLLGFAFISQPIFAVFRMVASGSNDMLAMMSYGNVLFALSFSLLALILWHSNYKLWAKLLGLSVIAVGACYSEYGLAMMLWTAIFTHWKDEPKKQVLHYLISTPFAYVLTYGTDSYAALSPMQMGVVLAAGLMMLFNHQKGRSIPRLLGGRYFFYIIYPLHLAVILLAWAVYRIIKIY